MHASKSQTIEDLTGQRIYPYLVLFAVTDSDRIRWFCTDRRTGAGVIVTDGHLRCLLHHAREQLAADVRRREFVDARVDEEVGNDGS